jgi:hypothetical protein
MNIESVKRRGAAALHDIVRTGLLLVCTAAGAAPQGDAVPCQARSLGFDLKEAGWQHVPLSKLKRDTVYKVVQEGDRRGVLRASADRSASMYASFVKPAMRTPMTLSWDWKTDALVPGADNRDSAREDAPLRVVVAFDGDHASLPEAEKTRFERARKLTGKSLPYAVLMYVWSDHVAPGTVMPSAHTSQVKMLAVASGQSGLGGWHTVERNLADDYMQAYGSAPGPVLGIGVMTDTDNTRTQATGEYADIRIACGKG